VSKYADLVAFIDLEQRVNGFPHEIELCSHLASTAIAINVGSEVLCRHSSFVGVEIRAVPVHERARVFVSSARGPRYTFIEFDPNDTHPYQIIVNIVQSKTSRTLAEIDIEFSGDFFD
jgi:hypothetical protein